MHEVVEQEEMGSAAMLYLPEFQSKRTMLQEPGPHLVGQAAWRLGTAVFLRVQSQVLMIVGLLQGFASGSLERDATAVRLFADAGMELLLSQVRPCESEFVAWVSSIQTATVARRISDALAAFLASVWEQSRKLQSANHMGGLRSSLHVRHMHALADCCIVITRKMKG